MFEHKGSIHLQMPLLVHFVRKFGQIPRTNLRPHHEQVVEVFLAFVLTTS